ncbi:hypothetical protein C0Q70_20434 [Pomacea canaliculata]|uniref:Ig-like domain-containing protein n=1 Tax=Pomacea canaliculata TaxID=400727 RepID=A0A2T7NFJ8_POMCA|nr:hypothetical protein C0Q70_20434 [Pomacea canaliculata]
MLEAHGHCDPEIRITGHTYVEKSGSIRLICNATGEDHSPDDIDWFLNGQKLITDDANEVYIHKRVSLTDKTIYSSLEIKSADMSDAGIYVCRTSDLQIASARVDVLNGTRISLNLIQTMSKEMEQIRITDMLKIQIERGSTTHG